MRALLLAGLLAPAAAVAQVPEPEGFRGEPYRAPVPATLAGAVVLDTPAAHALWEEGAVFVDVLPRAPRPEGLPAGTIWRQAPRESVPGAVWLPNVGYAALAEVDDRYFREGLEAATAGDPERPVVFFCLDECWMSWNAAKRALGYGYTAVHWYPEGTDGWSFEDFPTEPVEPMESPKR
jgi:PQQ-dependent catabolism-associated CXXCW motif protein